MEFLTSFNAFQSNALVGCSTQAKLYFSNFLKALIAFFAVPQPWFASIKNLCSGKPGYRRILPRIYGNTTLF